jgi:glutamate:GABA antiporter
VLIAAMYILGTVALLGIAPSADIDPKSGVFHGISVGSIALNVGFLGVLAAMLVTVGNAGGVGSTVAGIARVPFVVGIDRYLPEAFGRIHPKWKTPYISILVQAILSAVILLLSQIKSRTVMAAYQVVVDAAIVLYFIPFLYMFAAVIKLAYRKDRNENAHAVLVPGGLAGVWICGSLGFVVVLCGIVLSFFPPGGSDTLVFEIDLIGGTVASILLGLVLYWRGARSKQKHGA